MARMADVEPTRFVGENLVYRALKHKLPDEVFVYNHREINGGEFDFCLLVEGLGFVIVEVKGWRPNQVLEVKSPDQIIVSGFEKPLGSPLKQARGYRFELINHIQETLGCNVRVSSLVCYPFLSEKDYYSLGLRVVSEPSQTIFKEDLENKESLIRKIGDSLTSLGNNDYKEPPTKILRSLFEPVSDSEYGFPKPYSELIVIPDLIGVGKASEIVSDYSEGTKIILFVQKIDSLLNIANKLNDLFSRRGIRPSGSGLIIGINNSPLEVKDGRISCFGFEAYCLDLASLGLNEEMVIFNGAMNADQEALLNELGKKTNFNFGQYALEHAPIGANIEVRAGAGSGKTFSMVSRIAFLTSRSSKSGIVVPSEEIAMLTFTRDAASNMKTRLKERFQDYFLLTKNRAYLDLAAEVERMQISTIHSFAKEVISSIPLPAGVGSDFTPTNGNYKREKCIKERLDQFLENTQPSSSFMGDLALFDPYCIPRDLSSFVNKIYNKGCDLLELKREDFGEVTGAKGPNDAIVDLLYDVMEEGERDYCERLAKNNQVPLDRFSIVLKKCIKDDSFNKDNFHFKYLFIDEFQDVDDSQIEIFLSMWRKLQFSFFIVGDIKQSIYRFRGATLDAFTRMKKGGGNWISYSLQKNYRSDRRLLDAFDPIFKRMAEKGLLPYQEGDRLIGVKQCDEESYAPIQLIHALSNAEKKIDLAGFSEAVLKEAAARKNEIERRPDFARLSRAERTIAILVRTNRDGENIVRIAKRIGIEVDVEQDTGLFSTPSAIDLCKLTSALCNPYNPKYLFDLITSNYLKCGFDATSLLGKNEIEKTAILTDCLDQCFKAWMNASWSDLVKYAQQEPALKVLHEIYVACRPWAAFTNDGQKIYRINYDLVLEFINSNDDHGYLTIEGINERLVIAASAHFEAHSGALPVEDGKEAKIVILTIHKSKGLEYDTVFVPFLGNLFSGGKNLGSVTYENGVLGFSVKFGQKQYTNEYYDSESESEEGAKEEARIAYVALTRAINHVFIGVDDNNKNGSFIYLISGVEDHGN